MLDTEPKQKPLYLTDRRAYNRQNVKRFRDRYPIYWCIELDGKKVYFHRKDIIEKTRLNHIPSDNDNIIILK